MNRPLRRQTKKELSLFFSTILVSTSVPVYAEQRIKSGTPLYFETKVKKGQSARIRVKDNESGKNASLLLSPSDKPELASGYFLLQFDHRGPDLELLDFYMNNKKLSTFSPEPNAEKVYRVYLFSTPQEQKKFSERFVKADKQAAPTQLPQEMKPAELPNELPKVQALQTKTEEVQKKEDEIKLNLEATEAQKRAERMALLAKMKEEEKAQRKEKAKLVAEKALQHYKKGEYKEAASLFAQASSLDPESDAYYFQHGVSLYKTKNYKKSLALLSIAESTAENKTELNYFKALNHMKLQEYDQALDEFTAVKEEDDENLSAPAAFYAGNIAYRKENYPVAREHLEYTIDNSKDPKTDQQAENLIEEIDRIESFQSRAKEQYKYTLTAGMGYDSNVLNTALQNLATNAEAVRFNYSGSFLYRFLYDYRNELSGELNLSDMYSVTPSFQPDSALQAADPLVLSASLPYRRQSLLGKKVVNWGFVPTYQTITMSVDQQTRKQILSSTTGKFDANFMRNAEWMSSYRFEYAVDTSSISSSADDDLSGTRMILGTSQTKLLNQRGTNTWSYSLDYTMNQTQGKNYQYNKINLGLGYTDKVFNDHDGTLKLEYSYLNYPQATTSRTDNLTALSATLSKEYWPSTYLNYSGQFNLNSSDVSAYRYDRFVVNISVTFLGSKKKSK